MKNKTLSEIRGMRTPPIVDQFMNGEVINAKEFLKKLNIPTKGKIAINSTSVGKNIFHDRWARGLKE